MKWQARSKYSRAERQRRKEHMNEQWHSKFALLPIFISEKEYDSIVVPSHWVWLERYETRWRIGYGWEQRLYTGAPSLGKLVRG